MLKKPVQEAKAALRSKVVGAETSTMDSKCLLENLDQSTLITAIRKRKNISPLEALGPANDKTIAKLKEEAEKQGRTVKDATLKTPTYYARTCHSVTMVESR